MVHIINHTISNDEKNLELLILVITWVGLAHIVDAVENRPEMSWTVQVDIVVADAVLVVLDHIVQIVYTWIKNVAIHGEAVRSALTVGRDTTTEAEQVDLLVRVVVLEDAANLVDHLQILVPVHVEVVQTVWVLRVSI